MKKEEIATQIFDVLKTKGIKQKELEKNLGVNQSTIAGWKSRNCPPPIKYIIGIADFLDITLYELLGLEEPGIKSEKRLIISEEEKDLIRCYRNMNKEKQNILLGTAQNFANTDTKGLSSISKII